MLLDESYFDTFPKEIRYNQYVLVLNRGTYAERVLKAYDSEIEAYKIYRKCSGKLKSVVKAKVTYVNIEGRKFLYDYEEIQ